MLLFSAVLMLCSDEGEPKRTTHCKQHGRAADGKSRLVFPKVDHVEYSEEKTWTGVR